MCPRAVGNASIGTLLSPDGHNLQDMGTGKAWVDAEGVASVDTLDPFAKGIFVSFEREHRIWKYPAVNGTISLLPDQPIPGIGNAQDNEMKKCPCDDHSPLAPAQPLDTSCSAAATPADSCILAPPAVLVPL